MSPIEKNPIPTFKSKSANNKNGIFEIQSKNVKPLNLN